MENRSKKENFFLRKGASRVIVLAIAAFWIALTALGLLQKFDYRVYDLLLGFRRAPAEQHELLFVEVDNQSLEELGPWPWTRDILADALLRMKELGAATAVFDIEYLSPSNLAIAPDAAEKLGAAFDAEKRDIADVVGELTAAVTGGFVSHRELPELSAQMLEDYINPGIDALYDSVEASVYRDNDAYFAQALQCFGNSWLTINIVDIETKLAAADEAYVVARCLYDNVVDEKDAISRDNAFYALDQGNELGFAPALQTFIEHARGAGFTNIVLDSDGSRRRVELLHKHTASAGADATDGADSAADAGEDVYVAQLVLSPLLSILTPEKIIRRARSLTLVQAQLPNAAKRADITIPLDEHGRMLVNWQHKEFVDSFRHESVFFLHQLDLVEKNVVSLLQALDGFRLWNEDGSMMAYTRDVAALLDDYRMIAQGKQLLMQGAQGYDAGGEALSGGVADDDLAAYFALREAFFSGVARFAGSDAQGAIAVRLAAMHDELDAEQAAALTAQIGDLFDSLRHESDFYAESFAELRKSYKGAFCIIGETASSTTDLGNTPFNRAYPNIGTHANVYNTIVTQSFIRPVHWLWFTIAISALAFVMALVSEGASVLRQNTAGIALVLVSVCIPPLFMALFGVYIPAITPALIALSTFLIITLLNFISSDKDKRFLRSAFSTYLAPTVVDQIVKHPEQLRLGGDEKEMTALFSDVRSFSTFSEMVTPTELVRILNEYLGAMSDRILEADGTIDKYIGDAIVSFFGAPLDLPNHAYSACYAAIRMKEAEYAYNAAHADELPMKLETRIGINTGDMVVGNMGTTAKFNYTMMGDNVNLASRLEGVNKAYASWILASEATWHLADSGDYKGKLVARKFDRVRVVGKEVPVLLYNVLGVRAEMPQEQIDGAELFNQATDCYLAGDFARAQALYEQSQKLFPASDGTPAVFIERCKAFIAAGKSGAWDGVYTMTDKGHD